MHNIIRNTALTIALGVLLLSGHEANAEMAVTGPTSQPVGHYEFCKIYPQDCTQNDIVAKARLDERTWQTMLEINDAVNVAIAPRTDEEMHGVPELWSYPTTEGDCEDYALLKRYMLEREGFPRSALLITVLRQPSGAGHAVLTVRTDRGDFILDNLDQRVLDWEDTVYLYLKRQSEKHAGKWVGIADDRGILVGSVR